jgi:hypothetical protein
VLRSAEYQRGYDAGYKQALLDAVRERVAERGYQRRPRDLTVRLGDASDPVVRKRLRDAGIFP